MRLIFQLIVLVGGFTGLYFGLSKIDYVGEAGLAGLGKRNVDKLGELMIESILMTNAEIKDSTALAIIDSLKRPLCLAGGLNPDSVYIHLIRSEDVNAFALPGGHIMLHNSLFEFAKDPGEVAGVLGHELGHLKLGHIEKKLAKEVGMSILFTIAGGEGGQEILKQIVKQISSTSFDRDYEREADEFAVKVMAESGLNPERLSDFMFRIGSKQNMPKELVFISTHPDSKERAATIIKNAKKYEITPKPVLTMSWEEVQKIMN